MAELRGLSVKVPIKFSERAQKKLYETCMAYKELAEVRGAENEMLREAAERDADVMEALNLSLEESQAENARLRELVLHTVECVRRLNDTSENGGCVLCPYLSTDYDCDFESRARDLGIEADDDD